MNKITTKKISPFKKLIRYIFLKPFGIVYIMHTFDCTFKQAKNIYDIQKHFYNRN